MSFRFEWAKPWMKDAFGQIDWNLVQQDPFVFIAEDGTISPVFPEQGQHLGCKNILTWMLEQMANGNSQFTMKLAREVEDESEVEE